MIYHFLIFVIANAFFNYLIINQNQNFHYIQILVLVIWFFFGFSIDQTKKDYLRVIGLIFTYPFLFNSFLNLFRRLPIEHLGKYDFLSFPVTILFCCFGLALYFFMYILKSLDKTTKL